LPSFVSCFEGSAGSAGLSAAASDALTLSPSVISPASSVCGDRSTGVSSIPAASSVLLRSSDYRQQFVPV